MRTITVDGVLYKEVSTDTSGYVILRCRDAGVHCGIVTEVANGWMTVENSRRLWRWVSKATISELATDGPVQSEENKYGCVLHLLKIRESDVCEIIPCSDKAAKAIMEVKVWVVE